MPEFRFFVDPEDLFTSLNSLDDVLIVGRRFIDSGLTPGYHLLDTCSYDSYSEGRFREILISVGGPPSSPDDWSFLDREEQNLLIIDGGGLSGEVLEGWRIRTFAKRSKAAGIFRIIKSKISKLDGDFGYQESGTSYSDIFVTESARKYKLSLRV